MEGGESTGEILPATGSVRRNILIIFTYDENTKREISEKYITKYVTILTT